MSVAHALHQLRRDPNFMRNVTAWKTFPARQARYAAFPDGVDRRLRQVLARRGIPHLYTHQAEAVTATLRRKNVVVVTPTASGKTLCYNLPVLNVLLADPNARALYLFPTKALAQDQLAELNELSAALGKETAVAQQPLLLGRIATYDGDTPSAQRPRIRKEARVILTNPDMLHTSILPYHTRWSDFFAHLRYVVLDEMHVYRGVFGSHVANVLRRLRRVCRFHGSRPQFIATSATIANPQALAEALLETPVTPIGPEFNGAPAGEKHVILYNPPIVDRTLGLRRASTLEAQRIAAHFLRHNVQTIIFGRARLTVEVLLGYLRESLREMGEAVDVRGYRGGYLPIQRREIERGLREGNVRGVVATNALELGVDIGRLEAAVLVGYPGSIASTWQQAGRAGRRRSVSVAVLVATAGALDQYIVTHPEFILERSPEHAYVNPDNLVILSNHLRCAAFELPFQNGEMFGRFEQTDELLAYLAEGGELRHFGDTWYWLGEGYPAQDVSLRTVSADRFVVQARTDGGQLQVIGEMDRFSVPLLLHEGAIYIHEGQTYQVTTLDWDGGTAEVEPVQVDYYTRASITERVQVVNTAEQTTDGGTIKAHGEVEIIAQATGFKKIRRWTHENLGWGEIDLPEQTMVTTAYWLSFPDATLEQLRASGLWRSAPVDYGPNWPEQRARALERDRHRCRHCGAPERPGREHDVHHIRPFREFGYIPGENENYRQANRLENLITLCPSCHRRAETVVHVRTGLAGLAYALHNVAPLHLMCDPRDLGVVSEARSVQTRLPTVTIYDRVPAGIGFAQRLYDLHSVLLQGAHDLVQKCGCAYGCPACVGPVLDMEVAQRLSEEQVNTKMLTLALIEAALADETDHGSPAPGG